MICGLELSQKVLVLVSIGIDIIVKPNLKTILKPPPTKEVARLSLLRPVSRTQSRMLCPSESTDSLVDFAPVTLAIAKNQEELIGKYKVRSLHMSD